MATKETRLTVAENLNYNEIDSINSVQSSLKSHPYPVFNLNIEDRYVAMIYL